MNYLPTQSAPILKYRNNRRVARTTNYLTVSTAGIPNSCTCDNSGVYEACKVSESTCDTDRAPTCYEGSYGCSCSCDKD